MNVSLTSVIASQLLAHNSESQGVFSGKIRKYPCVQFILDIKRKVNLGILIKVLNIYIFGPSILNHKNLLCRNKALDYSRSFVVKLFTSTKLGSNLDIQKEKNV